MPYMMMVYGEFLLNIPYGIGLWEMSWAISGMIIGNSSIIETKLIGPTWITGRL